LYRFFVENFQSVKSEKSVDDFLLRTKFYIACINMAVRVLLEKYQHKIVGQLHWNFFH